MKTKVRRCKRMRLLVVICAFSCLLPPAVRAQQTGVSVKNVRTMKQLISQIEAGSTYRFSYQDKEIENRTVKVADGTRPVKEILTEALRPTPYSFVIMQNDIIITKNARKAQQPVESDKNHISGRVIDAATQLPVVGAQVWLKDTAIGTITNSKGEYELDFTGNYAYLNISFIGYTTLELPIGNRSVIDAELAESTNVVDEVVVVGYGVQKKASVIGAISSVPVSSLRNPVAKVSNSLAGQLAGVISVQRSGEPGASSTFWIRGISTFGSNSKPLVLVDGIERDLDLVDAEDIRELSILKDASATAIYGVRGANGVVLITTRSGDVGKPKISLKYEAGLVTPTKVPEMINSVQFARMYNDAAGYKYYSDEAIEAYRTGSDPDLYPNVDWVGNLYKDYAMNQRVNLSVSGGGSVARYYVAGGFYNEDGLFATDNMKRYDTSVFFRRFNFRANVDINLHKYTVMTVNLATTFERKNEPGSAATGSGSIWDYALRTSPNAFPMVYSNGLLAGPGLAQGENPYVLLTQTGYREKFYNTAQSLFGIRQDLGEWVTEGLSVSVKASFDAQNFNNHGRTKTPEQYLATGRDEEGNLLLNQVTVGQENLTYKEQHSGYRTVYLEAQANYTRKFGRHNVGALFLYQQSQKNNVGVSNSELALPYRHQGIAGRITYDFDTRYFIEANFGYNGSENFSPKHRFGFFPSVAAGWLVSNEKFFQKFTDVVDMLKLKASYGLVGNDQIGGGRRFIYNATVDPGNKLYFGKNALNYSTLRMGEWPNDNVGWEKSYKLNVGVDLSLFRCIKIQADYFKEKREGIFLQRESIPGYAGISTQPWVNVGKMNNQGFDLSLESHHRIGEVELTVRGNFTYARNKIIDKDEPAWAYSYMNRTGQAQYQKFGLVAAGLFRDQEDIDSWAPQKFGTLRPGDIKYVDINGDGVVDSYDVKPLGYPNVPEIVYGFGFSLRWKSFDLAAFFQGVAHVNFFTNTTPMQPFTARNIKEDGVFAVIDGNYWREDNLDARYPRLDTSANTNNSQTSTFWMVNGRYMRLKNLEVGYTLPKRLSSKLHMEGLRVYLSAVNLFTFSPFKIWDPDLQTGATSYPNNKVYNIGVSLAF